MLFDLFSCFDDCNATIPPLLVILAFVLYFNKSSQPPHPQHSHTVGELADNHRVLNTMSGRTVLVSLFVLVGYLNPMGLYPYMFSMTSHLATNLALSLPLWVAILLASSSFSGYSFLSHLQPTGAPAALSPFLCLIELVSLIIRPLTLCVRLAANLSTGHIFIALLAGSAALTIPVGVFYFAFEFAICGIQNYIFTLLPLLYLEEHP
uniref:ATP synthase subunit a n=1 Tax=Flustrellidra hispida TaxID=97271 RepID=Q15K49_9BILA|nr:ATP synthase F0 subunit 6 [Flustrellidra hispida]AAZ76756.1 ATP synthase F0 subunit 6 [Flustrellidra hispida]